MNLSELGHQIRQAQGAVSPDTESVVVVVKNKTTQEMYNIESLTIEWHDREDSVGGKTLWVEVTEL